MACRCILVLLLALWGCNQRPAPARPANRARPTIASTVPAVTDLLVDMAAADHLVAVSTYDVQRPELRGLPRIGDYQTLDWEQIGILRPDVLIVFMAPNRMPPALRQKADQMGIRLVNVRTETLADVYLALPQLGDLVHEPAKSAAAAQRLRTRLDAVRQRVRGKPPIPTVLVHDVHGAGVVGRDNFLDDILTLAGGQNLITDKGWSAIDREKLLTLQPHVIVQLLPDASPQVLEQAQRTWQSFTGLRAVQQRQIHILTDWWVIQPGAHLADLAERLADLLHPPSPTDPAHRPLTQPSSP